MARMLELLHSINQMNSQESIINNRVSRLSLNKSLLGEPDIISIKQTKYSTGFFGKQKKIQDLQENFINGLIFPTTAHFSSFISSRYKAKDHNKFSLKARLLMFDAYGQKDIHIEVSIPGALQVKAYNLKGQETVFSKEDYERAYFSSFLRSLYPMNYPNIIIYPLLNRIELLKSIVRSFIPFSFKNELRDLNYEFENQQNDYKDNRDEGNNISLQLVVSYLIDNMYFNLLKILQQELKKLNLGKYYQTQIRWKLKEKKFGEIICKTAQKLLLHGQATKLKQHQIQALFPLKKYAEIAFIGKSILESSNTSPDISRMILISLIEINEDTRFLKAFNLVTTLHNNSYKKIHDAAYGNGNQNIFQFDTYIGKNKSISEYPQFCFPFDNALFNRLLQYKNQYKLLKQNAREGVTVGLLEKVQQTLTDNPLFYDILVKYEKLRGWKSLLKNRSHSFWLESDFQSNEEIAKRSKNKQFDDNYSFFDQNFNEDDVYQQDLGSDSIENAKNNESPGEKQQQYQKGGNQGDSQESSPQKQKLEESFDGNLSQHQQQTENFYLPKCSARVNTIRKRTAQKKMEFKILCGVNLQRLFMLLFNDLKLQTALQSWQQKLREVDLNSFSVMKRQLTALIYLKKGMLHRKLQRNKRCEQAFKMARKLSCSRSIQVVSTYQLILLYIENQNTKGVEFYLIELMKLLKAMGVEHYDIVPEWAKPILHYVLEHEGLGIIKNIHPVFKSVFGIFLRSNYLEEQVEKIIMQKKEK